jgi:hypothetical protein
VQQRYFESDTQKIKVLIFTALLLLATLKPLSVLQGNFKSLPERLK